MTVNKIYRIYERIHQDWCPVAYVCDAMLDEWMEGRDLEKFKTEIYYERSYNE